MPDVYHPATVTIEHLDGTTETAEHITRTHVADGVLWLFRRWSFRWVEVGQ